jgi:hypothetical protein
MTMPTTNRTMPVGISTKSRPMRSERLVALRSTMPVQLVTLRHTVPLRLGALTPEKLAELTGNDRAAQPQPGQNNGLATPKVDRAERAVETTAGKGGDAR